MGAADEPAQNRHPVTMRALAWIAAQVALLVLVLVLPGGTLTLRADAIMLAAAGAALALAAARSLGPGLTPSPHPRSTGRFAEFGPYRWMRHPMYVAVTLLALAYAVATGSALRVAATLALAAFFDAKASYEEQWLLKRYPQYAAYRARVKKFVPFLY